MSIIESDFKNEKEGIPDIVSLTKARAALSPLTEEGKIAVSPKNNFWKERPYPHELTIVSAWARLIEKKARGEIAKNDVENLGIILNWILSLREEQVLSERPKNRSREPPLIGNDTRTLMSMQAAKLRESEEFLKIEGWENYLVSIARGYVLILSKNKIYAGLPAEVEKRLVGGMVK